MNHGEGPLILPPRVLRRSIDKLLSRVSEDIHRKLWALRQAGEVDTSMQRVAEADNLLEYKKEIKILNPF